MEAKLHCPLDLFALVYTFWPFYDVLKSRIFICFMQLCKVALMVTNVNLFVRLKTYVMQLGH